MTAARIAVAAAIIAAGCAQPGSQAQTAPAGASSSGLSAGDIGVRLIAANQNEMAVDAYARQIAAEGVSAEAFTGLGVAYHRLGRPKFAIKYFRGAIDLDPNLAVARNNLGVALYAQGEITAALSEFERAFALTGGLDPAVRTNIGIAEIAIASRAEDVEVDDADFDVIQYGQGVYRLQERNPAEKAAPKTAPTETEAQS